MGFYIALVLMSVLLKCHVNGQTTQPEIPVHHSEQGMDAEASILRFLLNEVTNLKSEISKEKGHRLLLEKEVDDLKNNSCCNNKTISESMQSGLQVLKSSFTFQLDLELKQQRNDIMDEITKLQAGFDTKLLAANNTISNAIATSEYILLCMREKQSYLVECV